MNLNPLLGELFRPLFRISIRLVDDVHLLGHIDKKDQKLEKTEKLVSLPDTHAQSVHP